LYGFCCRIHIPLLTGYLASSACSAFCGIDEK
jgi:hypothetical protein